MKAQSFSIRLFATVFAASVIAALGAEGEGWAQEAVSASQPPVCMAHGDLTDDRTLKIVVPRKDERAMSAQGFLAVECEDAFASRAEMSAWRDRVCTMAASSDQRMQDLIAIRYGAAPSAFCGMAEAALSQWQP